MTRCKGEFEKMDVRTGKPIRCELNAHKPHEFHVGSGYRWKNDEKIEARKKKVRQPRIQKDDGGGLNFWGQAKKKAAERTR